MLDDRTGGPEQVSGAMRSGSVGPRVLLLAEALGLHHGPVSAAGPVLRTAVWYVV